MKRPTDPNDKTKSLLVFCKSKAKPGFGSRVWGFGFIAPLK